jgi:hypothetical protein
MGDRSLQNTFASGNSNVPQDSRRDACRSEIYGDYNSRSQAFVIVVDLDSLSLRKVATTRLYLNIVESPYERENFDLNHASLLLSRNGRVEALPVNNRTSPDGTQEAKQAGSLNQLWLFASVPADIVTSPLQLIAAPFVIPILGLRSSRW